MAEDRGMDVAGGNKASYKLICIPTHTVREIRHADHSTYPIVVTDKDSQWLSHTAACHTKLRGHLTPINMSFHIPLSVTPSSCQC